MTTKHARGNTSAAGNGEAPPPSATGERNRGGWITTPFIIATFAGLSLATGGCIGNLIVFLIREFNIKSIDAAQVSNVVSGCVNFFPLVGAIVADSFLGCFSVIWISSLIHLLGAIVMMLTVTINGLKPPNCENGSILCLTPSRSQYAALYAALALVCIGRGGSTFTLATMGANQFTKPNHHSTYFNWYFFTLYLSSLISSTAVVYIEDNVSWAWGFGISIAANVIGLAMFLIGSPFYCRQELQGSPFTSLVRVIVASVRKRKAVISSRSGDYYYGDDDDDDDRGIKGIEVPSNSLRLLNRAALKTEGDVSSKNPWKLCTVEQVEDLKTLIRILPLWSTSILLGTPIGIQASLTVLQALTTDRHLSPRFQVPPGSMIVFSFLSTAIFISLFDHLLWPLWKKLGGKNPTPLQQLGIGHVFNFASMAVSALVESRRRAHHDRVSVLWLVPQMVIVGIGEAFILPGQVSLYYQEFPTCLKSLATAMVAMLIAVAFYLSTGVIDFVRRVTNWLPDDIDQGRVDNVYWVMVVLGVLNFGYYLVCSWFYEYKSVEVVDEGDQSLLG